MKLSSPWVGRAVLSCILLAFGAAAWELARRWRAEAFEVELSWLLASMVPLGAGYCSLALAFQRTLRAQAGERPGMAVCFEVYFRGLLARYLPGKVGVPAVRMAAARGLGVPPAYMAASAVLESLAALATAGVLAASLSLGPWAAPRLNALSKQPWAPWVIAAMAFGVVLLAVIDVRRYPRGLMRLAGLEQVRGALLPVAWIVGSACYWGLLAISCAMAVLALDGSTGAALLGAAAGIIAPVIGFFVVVAPGGLGVREAVIVALMSAELGPTKALAFSLVTRGAALATELVLWFATRVWLSLQGAESEAREA